MEKKPTFFWQGLLILLPLVLLLAFGMYSLRQDRTLAEAEAKERAQGYAEEVGREISSLFSALLYGAVDEQAAAQAGTPTFLISTNGDLIWPRRVASLRPVVLSSSSLNSQQLQLWHSATEAEFTSNRVTAINSFRRFLKSDPPLQYAARACYSLGVLLGDCEESRALFSKVELMKDSMSEAGLPLSLLAKMKRIEFQFAKTGHTTTNDESLQKLCSYAIENPTIITEEVLDFAERIGPKGAVEQSKRLWANEQLGVALYDASRKDLLTSASGLFWIDGDASYIAVSQPQAGQTLIACCPQPLVVRQINKVLKSATYVPAYFGLTIEIAGRELTRLDATPWIETSYFSPRSPGNVSKKEFVNSSVAPVLASASGTGPQAQALKVNVVLTNRSELFKRQQTRTAWFMCLIVASGVMAGSGLMQSWRTFQRQQQLNEMKSNFVSSVSHELRAPIASVRLLAEALDRGAVSEEPKRKEYFRFIVQECRRLTGLIENVLDFSRIEQGRKQYRFEETDLRGLVEQTVRLMEPTANERGVTVEMRIADCELQIVCDGLAVQQAVVNLIDNAVKHSPAGERVVIGLEKGERPTSNVQRPKSNETALSSIRLSVTDRGAGIPAEEHQKIFERFYRRGSELRRETQGIGIGLTIVKHVAEAHGGRVWVESVVGTGSKFTIELPEAQAEEKARNRRFEI